MNNKKIEELINEAKSRNVLAKDPNKLREKWLKEALTQVHNSAIEGLLGQPGSPQHFTRHTPDNISSQPMKNPCKKCDDKGYRTELRGRRDLGKLRRGDTYSDFHGEQIGTFIKVDFCDCQRGKDLKKYFNINL